MCEDAPCCGCCGSQYDRYDAEYAESELYDIHRVNLDDDEAYYEEDGWIEDEPLVHEDEPGTEPW